MLTCHGSYKYNNNNNNNNNINNNNIFIFFNIWKKLKKYNVYNNEYIQENVPLLIIISITISNHYQYLTTSFH